MTIWTELARNYSGDRLRHEAGALLYNAHHRSAGRVPNDFTALAEAERERWIARGVRALNYGKPA